MHHVGEVNVEPEEHRPAIGILEEKSYDVRKSSGLMKRGTKMCFQVGRGGLKSRINRNVFYFGHVLFSVSIFLQVQLVRINETQ